MIIIMIMFILKKHLGLKSQQYYASFNLMMSKDIIRAVSSSELSDIDFIIFYKCFYFV